MQDSAYVPELPEHPELRELAQVIENAGMMGEILDASFLCVFFSSESARAMGLSADEASSMIGKSTKHTGCRRAATSFWRVDGYRGW